MAEKATRLGRMHQQHVREKIRASMLVDRLEKHAEGEIELTATQVQAAKILLDKCVSNAPTDINVDANMNVTLENMLHELVQPKGN